MLPSRMMTVRRAQLAILLVVSLLLGASQCLASCTADSFKSGVPPCHQKTHHSVPGHQTLACVQDFVVPNGHLPTHFALAALVVMPVDHMPASVAPEISLLPSFSPPVLPFSSPDILRL